MTAEQLKAVFEKKYVREDWYKILRGNFNVTTLREKPADITHRVTANAYNARAAELGNVHTTDGHLIGIYEVEVPVKAQIHRNRKGLRNLLSQVYSADVEAALLVFIQGDKWRFSYVSEISVKDKTTGKRTKKTTDPKRFTYLLGEGERAKTAADRFARVQKSEDLYGSGVTLTALEDAFNVEKMSKAFFNEYRKQYGYFTAYLTGEDENGKKVNNASPFLKTTFNGDHKEARDFVKKMLGRIVFLYFLEKKGWLGVPTDKNWGHGDENFLSNLFNHCKEKKAFYSSILVPLFFGTLNTERTKDHFKIDDHLFTIPGYSQLKIPYLNGGLFEEDEFKTQILAFPEKLFAGLFSFFDQYNFTVYEDSPDEHTVAVDPEMLGHIFENLLEDNKDKGAFYTPKEIVHYMCRESLIEYLYTRLNPQETGSYKEMGKAQTEMFGNAAKKQLSLEQTVNQPKEIISRYAIEKLVLQHEVAEIIEHDEAILKALKEVKICDPAIGSGAFPMGLLTEIFQLIETLYDISPDVTGKVWKLGAKWNPAKVKEEIIQNSIYGVDIEKGAVDIARLRFWLSLVVDEDTPKPLPNLDYKIVVGNSLLSKFEDEVIDIDWNIKPKNASAVQKIINDQQAKLVLLYTRQYEYFQAGIDKHKQQLRIRDLKIDILVNQVTLEKIAFEENNKIQHSAFPTEKEKKRAAEITERIRDYNRTINKLLAIKKDKDAFLHFFDWKLDFPEVMNERVKKGDAGFDIVIANPPYINVKRGIPNADKGYYKIKYLTSDGQFDLFSLFIELASKLGKQMAFIVPKPIITNENYIKARQIILRKNLASIVIGSDIFEKASVESCIFITSAQQNCNSYNVFEFSNKEFFHKLTSTVIESESLPYNIINVEITKERLEIIQKINKESNLFQNSMSILRGIETGKGDTSIVNFETSYKLLRGEDVFEYGYNYQNLYVKYNAKEKSKFKPLETYISPKIMIRRVGSELVSSIDFNTNFLTLNTIYCCHSFQPGLEFYYLALLNSKLIKFWFKNVFSLTDKLFPYIRVSQLNFIPLRISKVYFNSINDFSKKIHEETMKGNSSISKKSNIDFLIYKLYSLTYEEACIVEGGSDWMSKEDYDKFSIE